MTSCEPIETNAETPKGISPLFEISAKTSNDIIWVDRNQRRDPE